MKTDLPLTINDLGLIVDENIQSLGFIPFMPTGFNDAGAIVGGNDEYSNGAFAQIQLKGQTGAQVQINAINDTGEIVGTYTNGCGEFASGLRLSLA